VNMDCSVTTFTTETLAKTVVKIQMMSHLVDEGLDQSLHPVLLANVDPHLSVLVLAESSCSREYREVDSMQSASIF